MPASLSIPTKAARRTRALFSALRLYLRGEILRIPTAWVTNEYAFSMGEDGWNYFRDLLAQTDRQPGLALEDSTFYRFFQHPRVRDCHTLEDLLFLHCPQDRPDGPPFALGTYPWGHWNRAAAAEGGKPFGRRYDAEHGAATRDRWGYRRNPWYDPGDPLPLQREWQQTLEVYRSLRKGYRPFWNGSYPEVTILQRADGARRAVRYNGQHRLAMLAHLGQAQIRVALGQGSFGVIREGDVESWHYVRSGACTPQHALAIFHAFFNLNGRERIDSLGIQPAY